MKFSIYFTSHILPDKLRESLLSDFVCLYMTVVYTNIQMHVLFLYILILFCAKDNHMSHFHNFNSIRC